MQSKDRVMGDTINEYAGQIKTARTEGLKVRTESGTHDPITQQFLCDYGFQI